MFRRAFFSYGELCPGTGVPGVRIPGLVGVPGFVIVPGIGATVREGALTVPGVPTPTVIGPAAGVTTTAWPVVTPVVGRAVLVGSVTGKDWPGITPPGAPGAGAGVGVPGVPGSALVPGIPTPGMAGTPGVTP
jgi:hypothetical protein